MAALPNPYGPEDAGGFAFHGAAIELGLQLYSTA
jgi:hypothetical protein